MPSSRSFHVVVTALLALLPACQATGGSSLLFGGTSAPQEDLVKRVERARDQTVKAQADFAQAFQLYQRLTAPQAVELESLSDDFEDAIESCQDRRDDMTKRLEAVREESEALFKGWNDELQQFSGSVLRKKSEAMMLDTQARAQRVIEALERVQTRSEPVLFKLKDYALFFHHNLNARAIATLQDTYKEFDGEFHALEAEITRTQGEIATFLENFRGPAPIP